MAQWCPTHCDSMDCTMPGFLVLHYLPELAQTHVHSVSDVIQPSYSLSSSSPLDFSVSQHQDLFQWVSSLHQSINRPSIKASASVLPKNIQDWFPLGLAGLISLLSVGLSRVFSSTTTWKHQFFGAQPSLSPNSHIHTWLLLIYHSENPRALKNYAKSTLPALNKWHNKVWMTAHPGFAVDFKSIVETYY